MENPKSAIPSPKSKKRMRAVVRHMWKSTVKKERKSISLVMNSVTQTVFCCTESEFCSRPTMSGMCYDDDDGKSLLVQCKLSTSRGLKCVCLKYFPNQILTRL